MILKAIPKLALVLYLAYIGYAIWDIQYSIHRALPVRLVTVDGFVIAQFMDHYSCEKWRRTSGPSKSITRFHCLGGL